MNTTPPSELYAALASFWQQQLERITTELPAVIASADDEALHRLRVALRRTRSLLKLFRSRLPEGIWNLDLLESELSWFSGETSPPRDLDVLLAAARQRDTVAALQPLIHRLEQQRTAARSTLREELKSARLQMLLHHWHTFIEALPQCGAPPPAARLKLRKLLPVQHLQLAHWLLKHGSRIGADAPAEKLHRLRIRAKRFRYLIDAFPERLPKHDGKTMRSALIALQDLLGEHQDAVAASERLRQLRLELQSVDTLTTETASALDEWLSELAEIQRDARARLPKRLLRFGRRCEAL